jgi:hypothetical protein
MRHAKEVNRMECYCCRKAAQSLTIMTSGAIKAAIDRLQPALAFGSLGGTTELPDMLR